MNKEFLRRLSLVLFLLPLSLATVENIVRADLDAQALDPLNTAYRTTDVVIARNNLKEALKGIEENQQGVAYFVTSIPPNNQKVQAWNREIEKYQEQLTYFPKDKPKPIESIPSVPKVVNWLYLTLLSFMFVPVTTSMFLLFDLEVNFKKINFKKINFHFRPKSRKEFSYPPLFEGSLKDPTLETSERIYLLIFELILYPFERLVYCFIPSYVDRFSYLSEQQRKEIKTLYDRSCRDIRIFDSYEKLAGLSHFEKIKILTFTNQVEVIDESSPSWLQKGDIYLENNRFGDREEFILFCGRNGFNYLGKIGKYHYQMRTARNKRVFWKIESFTESVVERGKYIYTPVYASYLENLRKQAKIH